MEENAEEEFTWEGYAEKINNAPVSFVFRALDILDDLTIGKRKKSMGVVVKKCAQQIRNEPSEADFLMKIMHPRDYLETKITVDIAISIRHYVTVLNILTGNDERIMKHIWKQVWFFNKLLTEGLLVPDIVTYILPSLSLVTRIRFLKNLLFYTADEQKVDEFYDLILKTYGVLNAQYVLPGCSLEKVKHTFTSGEPIKYSNKQLVFLHEKKNEYFHELVKFDVENENRILDFYDCHSKALQTIAGSDFQTFLKLFKNGNFSIGKRLTRKLVKNELAYVLENASDIHRRVHKRTLLKSLGSNFEKYFYSTWPTSLSDFCLDESLMKFLPKEKHLEVVQQGLHQKYNTSLSEHPELISEDLLETIQNVELRESLLEIKMQDSDDVTLVKFLGIEKSIPLIKERLNIADAVPIRKNLLVALVHTCKINNDLDALLDVLEYNLHRHSGDDVTIKSAFFNKLTSCFDLAGITAAHWDLILPFFFVNDLMNHDIYPLYKLSMFQLKLKFKMNILDDDAMSEHHLSRILPQLESSLTLIEDLPIFKGIFLKTSLRKLHFFNIKDKSKIYFELCRAIQKWNKKNPNDKIDYLSNKNMKENIKSHLKKKYQSWSNEAVILRRFITKKEECDQEFLKDLKQIFWENISDKFDTIIIEHFLKEDPLEVNRHFNEFIKAMEDQYFCDSINIWRLLKHYNRFQLFHSVYEYIVDTKKMELKGLLGIGLATMSYPQGYIDKMSIHKAKIADVQNEQDKENHRLIVKLLQNAKYNSDCCILPTIMKFCKDDTLHDSLPAVYYYFQHTPEKYLPEHLIRLANQAVSARKHALKLACSVLPTSSVYELINKWSIGEKNQSILEHTFWKTFKYFTRNEKSERFFSLVKNQIKSLNILISNAFKESCDLKRIPQEFRSSYFEYVWDLLDEKEKNGEKVSDLKDKIINSIPPEMFKELPYDCCSKFIKEELLKLGSKSSRTARKFTLNCLKHNSQKETLLNDVFDVILEFKNKYILNPDFRISCQSHSYIHEFVTDFFYDISDFNRDTVTTFVSKWNGIFSPVEDIETFIRFRVSLEVNSVKNLDDYVLKIAELYQSLLSEFGIIGVTDCFKDVLISRLPDIFSTSEYKENLFELAFKLIEQENKDLQILAISFLPTNKHGTPYCVDLQQKIINTLKNSNEKSVLLNLNLYIKDLD